MTCRKSVDCSSQTIVIQASFEPLRSRVVPKAEGLEKILIDDVRPRADDRIDHAIFNHVDENLLQTRANQRAG